MRCCGPGCVCVMITQTDTRNNRKSGTKKLVPVLTVKGGRPFGRPYPVPFSF